MVDMKNEVKKLVISVIITAAIALGTIPIWNIANANNGLSLASLYTNMNMSVNIGRFPSLLIIDDNQALENIKATPIQIRNQNSVEKDYNLYFFIDKKTTIDKNLLRVSIGNEIFKLNEMECIEDDSGYYYLVHSNTIDKYSNEDLEARIWLTEEAADIDNDAKLVTNFVTNI